MTRRNNFQINRDILVLAINGAGKTRLVYGSNLNFSLIKDYLADLITRGMVTLTGTRYFTTARGLKFIKTVARVEAVGQYHAPPMGVTVDA